MIQKSRFVHEKQACVGQSIQDRKSMGIQIAPVETGQLCEPRNSREQIHCITEPHEYRGSRQFLKGEPGLQVLYYT